MLQSAATEDETQDTISYMLDVQPIKRHIEFCTITSLEEGLLLLSKQGGFIYTTQGSIVQEPKKDYILVENHKVKYSLYLPKFTDFLGFYSTLPEYPSLYFPYNTSSLTTNHTKGIFGRDNLPVLHKENTISVEGQLASYIESRITDCIDLSLFLGYDILEKQLPKATLSIRRNNIILQLDYPLQIKQDKEVLSLNNISAQYRTNFFSLYKTAKMISEKESTNIDFDVSDMQFPESNGVEISKNKENTLIVIEDKSQQVSGEYLIFNLVIPNRPPVLYYIVPNSLDLSSGEYFDTSQLTAKDPDDDTLSFAMDPDFINNPAQPGIYTVNISITDGISTDYQLVEIEVV
jgi:hypothetical protein